MAKIILIKSIKKNIKTSKIPFKEIEETEKIRMNHCCKNSAMSLNWHVLYIRYVDYGLTLKPEIFASLIRWYSNRENLYTLPMGIIEHTDYKIEIDFKKLNYEENDKN